MTGNLDPGDMNFGNVAQDLIDGSICKAADDDIRMNAVAPCVEISFVRPHSRFGGWEGSIGANVTVRAPAGSVFGHG